MDNIPDRYCQCGCGNPAPIAPRNHAKRGWVKGQPIRFIKGHSLRNNAPHYNTEDRGHETACWVWQRGCYRNGYGALYRGGKMLYAHRYYYEEEHGPISADKELDHLCRVRRCVNPDHLEPVSRSINSRRGAQAKLTNSDIAEIRRLWASGISTRRIAAQFPVSHGHIYKIVKREKWSE